jgi:hypothetical protein
VPVCSSDADCMVGGTDLDWICIDNQCGLSPLCTSDDECVATESGWVSGQPCTAGGGECEAIMQVCLDIDGGHCATAPSDSLGCEELHMVEMIVPDIDGNDATVCGKPDAVCTERGVCFSPCTSNEECSTVYPSCNLGTGLCECTSDADCQNAMFPASSVCISGACGCGSDQECLDSSLGDMCVDGHCRCSSDQACGESPIPFDGGVYSCVEV